MGDLVRVIKGQAMFFIGFFYMLVMSYLAPAIIETMSSLSSTLGWNSNEVEGVSWLLVVIFYLFVLVILPINEIYQGIVVTDKAKQERTSPFLLSVGSVLMMGLGILLTVKAWYMIQIFADQLSGDTLTTVIFWVGLLASWIMSVIVAPITIIIQAQQE